MYRWITAIALILICGRVIADEQFRTVIGPANVDLSDGAEALRSGDAEAGVKLTERGMGVARNARERYAALSNLCAGYVMLRDYKTAMHYCDLAIEHNKRNWRAYNNRALAFLKSGNSAAAEQDLESGLALNPNSSSLRKVKELIAQENQPERYIRRVTIDDRPLSDLQ